MSEREQRILHELIKSREAIRRKALMLKRGRDETERKVTETFKPIIKPLNRLVTLKEEKSPHVNKKKKLEQQTVKPDQNLKVEDSNDESQNDQTLKVKDPEKTLISDDDDEHTLMTEDEEELITEDEDEDQRISHYFKLVKDASDDLDKRYGVYMKNDKFYFGKSPISFMVELERRISLLEAAAATAMSQKKDLVEELHRPARRNYPRRRMDVRGLDETWQADLVEMIPYARENGGYKYLLTCIDILSKYAWTVPVKSKTGKDIAEAMKSILSKGQRVPKHLHTDRGKEFYNKDFEAVMNKYRIHLYSTYGNLKASIVERFNRTLKNIMWKQFSLQGNHKWTNIVSKLTSDYNERKHRTIGMAPARVTHKNEKDILKTKFAQRVGSVSRKFKIGDKVRVSKAKHLFEKGYEPNWTTEVFTVRRVARRRIQ
ncbi:unnamed protein product [Trichogramma brassicae]|uniref:Integrase catalytic domain-containing protein n=1 Tax=Trichogramma brassicae TaxID=86971 RepID=A0A6H5HW32_9HYME|nr:unnamed protein product [Trichogramma brassicae]